MRRRGPEVAAAIFAAAVGGAGIEKAQADTGHRAVIETHDSAKKTEKSHADHGGEAHEPKVTVDVKFEGSSHGKGAVLGSVGGERHIKVAGKEALAGGALVVGTKLDRNGYAGNQVGGEASFLFKLGESPIYGGPTGAALLDLTPGMKRPGVEGALGTRFEAHVGNVVLGAEVKGVVGTEALVPGKEQDGHGTKPTAGVVGSVGIGGRF